MNSLKLFSHEVCDLWSQGWYVTTGATEINVITTKVCINVCYFTSNKDVTLELKLYNRHCGLIINLFHIYISLRFTVYRLF